MASTHTASFEADVRAAMERVIIAHVPALTAVSLPSGAVLHNNQYHHHCNPEIYCWQIGAGNDGLGS